MARTNLDDLLSNSASSGFSRTDIAQQLIQIASGASGGFNASGGGSGVLSSTGSNQSINEQISSLTAQMTTLVSAQQIQLAALQDNTQTLTQATPSQTSGASTAGGTAASIASTFLGGSSILSPILGGLLDAFGVGDSSQPAVAPTPFLLPAPVQYQGGISGNSPGQVEPVNYGASGQPRAQTSSSTPQVNIQISAMDSQSFLDHSDDIASAVKQALLNSHSLGDVISDL